VTQAYVGLAHGGGLGAGPCWIWLVDGPIGIDEPLAATGLIALLRGEEPPEAADGDQDKGRLGPSAR
jgi:hypothetical protein